MRFSNEYLCTDSRLYRTCLDFQRISIHRQDDMQFIERFFLSTLIWQSQQPCLPRLFRTTATWSDLVEAGVLRSSLTPPGGVAVPAGGLAGGGECKIIYVFRDLCDVCYSLFFYFPALFQVKFANSSLKNTNKNFSIM